MSSSAGSVDLVKRPRLIERISGGAARVVGVLIGGLLAALAWLLVMQEGYKRGLTVHDYNKVMGQVFADASGESLARTGYRATLVAGVLLAAIYALVVHRLLRPRRGIVAALAFAPVPLLAWGLALAPVVDAKKDTVAGAPEVAIPGGVLGIDGGVATLPIAILASLVVAMVIVRTYRLMASREWWRSRPPPRQETAVEIAAIAGVEPALLELPEERAEEAREGTRP